MKIGNEMSNIQGFGAIKQKKYDPKEAEVAAKLGMTYEAFAALSEEEKMQKVKEYNELYPDNPIKDKNSQAPDRGSEIDKFFNDVNWKNIKLQ